MVSADLLGAARAIESQIADREAPGSNSGPRPTNVLKIPVFAGSV